jgi:hypothetical protein
VLYVALTFSRHLSCKLPLGKTSAIPLPNPLSSGRVSLEEKVADFNGASFFVENRLPNKLVMLANYSSILSTKFSNAICASFSSSRMSLSTKNFDI